MCQKTYNPVFFTKNGSSHLRLSHRLRAGMDRFCGPRGRRSQLLLSQASAARR